MTKEEAINEIRSWDFLEGKEIEAIHTLIPELRESEDERVRRAIGLALTDVPEERFTSLGTTLKDCLAYLEKQKELSELGKYVADKRSEVGFYCNHKEVSWNEIPLEDRKHDYSYYFDGDIDCYPFIVRKQKINTEGDFGRGYDCGYEACLNSHGAEWFEKQKENPKSADSIPEDCASDVKCEDRWHKATDSLPDSTREVLCKDAIGNFFIGRYYKSTQSWKVVMYDDCDKGNEDNPSVVKWCEIPSEKQKEPHYTKRNDLFDKCVENCDPKVMKEVSDKVDEMLGKEQKPIKMEVYEAGKGTTICGQDYKCKKDYKIGNCRYIKDAIYHCGRDGYLTDQNGISWSCTPEWFNEYIQTNAEWAEEEKNNFVGGQFLQCKLSFDEFKEGEHYWLEYVGDDMYVGRSDNILNQKFHITPRQLYTLFSQQLEEVQGPPQEEKQVSLNYEPPFNENPSDKEIIEALIHHLNEQDGFLTAINCVSIKVILSWLEKQKEQKPAEKEITLTDFEEALNTFLFDFVNSPTEDCKPKEYIKKHSAEILKAAYKELNTQLQQDIFEVQQEGRRDGYEAAIEELNRKSALKEQKPAEQSEDEKIRKELIEQVGYILPDREEYDDEGNVLPAYHKRIERYRAYLEKEKEKNV